MKMPNGQEFQTTFWEDFSIADAFGDDAIKDTYKRAFEGWKEDLVYLTELVIVLNLKCWYWYEHNNKERSLLYSDLYYKTNDYAWDFVGDDEEKSRYFFEMTD